MQCPVAPEARRSRTQEPLLRPRRLFAHGEKRVTRLDDELEGIQRLDQVLRSRMAEQDLGEFRIVARPELQGGLVEALRGRIGRQRERAIAGLAEAKARPTGQPFGLGTCRPIELERRQVMVSEHLGVVVRAPERLDPPRRRLMLPGGVPHAGLGVRDVTDQQVAEDVLGLVAHRRLAFTPHEVLALEGVQEELRGGAVAASDALQRSKPERLPDH